MSSLFDRVKSIRVLQPLRRPYRFGRKIARYTVPPPVKRTVEQSRRARRERRALIDRQMALPYWERKRYIESDLPPVNVGFVGAGQYAQHHLKVMHSLGGVRIKSILTTGNPRVSETTSKYGIEQTFTDIEDFLSDSAIDCYVVVVPAHKTKDIALRCLGTGKPVLMEKPAGLSSHETKELVDCAAKNSTFGMVCMNRRFYSVVEHGLARLANCGPIRGATLEIPEAITTDRQSKRLTETEYDHWMFRNSVHGLDLLRYVLGDVTNVHSLAYANEESKNAAASFASVVEHDSGAVSTVLGLWDTTPVYHLKIVAETGWVEFNPIERGWFADDRRERLPLRIDPIDVDFRMGVYRQDSHFIEAVGKGRQPTLPACLLPDAYQTSLFIERILLGDLNRA